MSVHVLREILKNSWMTFLILGAVTPVLFFVSTIPNSMIEDINRDYLTESQLEQLDNTIATATWIPFLFIGFIILHGLLRTNARNIIATANVEKRMEKLKKLGIGEFIKQTKAELIDSSHRGNKLYKSKNIIENRELKFLVYQDKSTEREYISFVKDDFTDADEAMASKFHLSRNEYAKLQVSNEA